MIAVIDVPESSWHGPWAMLPRIHSYDVSLYFEEVDIDTSWTFNRGVPRAWLVVTIGTKQNFEFTEYV